MATTWAIPSAAEMEAQFPSATVKKAPKPKPPCKYGPRGTDGYCPKKPPASAVRTASASSGASSTKSKAPCKWGPRKADGYCPTKSEAGLTKKLEKLPEKIAQKGIEQGVKNVLAKKAVQEFGEGVAYVAKGGSIGTAVKAGGALAAGAVSTTVAAALLAGVASYYGTTYILDRLAEKKLKNTPEYRAYEAALAYRAARVDAARQLGRELTDAELKYFADQFKAQLKKIGG